MDYTIEAEGLRKALRRHPGAGRGRPRRPHGQRARRARPQRRRQDHRRAHPGHADRAPTTAARGSPATTSPREPGKVREAIGLTGQYASVDELLTGEQNLVMIGQLLDLSGKQARARAKELLAWFDLDRRRQAPGQDLLGRHAPPAGPRGQPRRPPVGDLPRRADDRPRPLQARGHVGRRAQPRRRRLDRPADHAVPRRGRRAGGRDHGDRPRPRDRARHARRPEADRRRPDADGAPARPDAPERHRRDRGRAGRRRGPTSAAAR